MTTVASAEMAFPGASEMAALMRAFDWTSVGLPPASAWPPSLKAATRIMLTSRYAMWLGWGPELRFLYNDAYGAMSLGKKHPWALGQPARDVWKEIWGDLWPRIEVVMRGEATWDEGLLLFLERSGYREETYHTFSYSPIIDDSGEIGGLFCVVTEETDRIIGERRLATLGELGAALAATVDEAEVYRAVERVLGRNPYDLPFTLLYGFDGTDDAMLLARTGIGEHRAAAPRLALGRADGGWPADEIVRAARPIVLGDLASRFGALPMGAWDEPPHTALVLPIAAQGSERSAGMFVAGMNPFRPADAASMRFVELIAGQIAASVANARAYEAERRRAASLAELDRAKTAFFSNVSHEFRTPLTLMIGPAEDLTDDATVADEVRDRATIIHRNALRLLKLVNTLLDFSRIEAGRVQATFEPTDFAAYSADLASSFRSAVERAGLRLVVADDTSRGAPPVLLDRDMWEKVVLNLLSNAFKHTFEGEIELRTRVERDRAVLTVRDTGVGIPAEQLPHIFERFHRVPNARSRTHEGTGIGLALVQELVRLHGGEMDVSSTVGRGTTFTVSIPVGRSVAAPSHQPTDSDGTAKRNGPSAVAFVEEALRWLPEGDGARAAPPAAPAVSEAVRAPAVRGRVLVADDNADMREYVARLLRAQGHSVTAVPDGAAALDVARAELPDLVLSDVMMPGLDGFQLLQALHASELTETIPVILLSARAGEEARVEGMSAGAADYLVKPFSARELVARVDAQVERSVRSARDRQARRDQERVLGAVERERARLRELFLQAPAAVAILRGPDFVYELANPEYLKLVNGRDIVGKPIRQALPELTGQGIFEILRDVMATGRPFVGQGHPANLADEPGGPVRDRFFNFVYQPLRESDGSVSGIFVLVVDVTQQVVATREAEQANRAKSEFLAAMSHELRTPLNAIGGYAQLLEMEIHGPLNEAQHAALDRLQRSEQHLLALVNDVLNFAKLEAGKVEYSIESVPVSDAIDAVRAVIEPQLSARGLEFVVEPSDGLRVCGDADKIQQILINLLSNAGKFTESGGRVTLGAYRAADARVAFFVRDTGIGIPADRQASIFDPFVQVHRKLTRNVEGTGLGLAISRDLARGMSGELVVESEEGKGSTFVLTLPSA